MTDAETPHLLTDPVIQVMPVGVAGGQWIYEVSINRAPAFKVKVDRETRVVRVSNREEQTAVVDYQVQRPADYGEIVELVNGHWPILLAIAYVH